MGRLIGAEKKFACAGACRAGFWTPLNRKSNRPSAETLPGTSASDPARVAAATNVARRRLREKANSVRNANSTQRNNTR
jgi:hypothetical protein